MYHRKEEKEYKRAPKRAIQQLLEFSNSCFWSFPCNPYSQNFRVQKNGHEVLSTTNEHKFASWSISFTVLLSVVVFIDEHRDFFFSHSVTVAL
jgi:hypothetical protein